MTSYLLIHKTLHICHLSTDCRYFYGNDRLGCLNLVCGELQPSTSLWGMGSHIETVYIQLSHQSETTSCNSKHQHKELKHDQNNIFKQGNTNNNELSTYTKYTFYKISTKKVIDLQKPIQTNKTTYRIKKTKGDQCEWDKIFRPVNNKLLLLCQHGFFQNTCCFKTIELINN